MQVSLIRNAPIVTWNLFLQVLCKRTLSGSIHQDMVFLVINVPTSLKPRANLANTWHFTQERSHTSAEGAVIKHFGHPIVENATRDCIGAWKNLDVLIAQRCLCSLTNLKTTSKGTRARRTTCARCVEKPMWRLPRQGIASITRPATAKSTP